MTTAETTSQLRTLEMHEAIFVDDTSGTHVRVRRVPGGLMYEYLKQNHTHTVYVPYEFEDKL